MREMVRASFLALAVSSASMAWSPSNAQSPPAVNGAKSGSMEPCSLLPKAELEKITGRRLYDAPDLTPLAGGSACTYEGGAAQIVVFSGEKSEERFNGLLESFGHENDKKHSVSGVGDSAYIIYPKPRNKYQDTIGLLVVRVGQHTLGISLAADESKPAESVQPNLVTLAQSVVAKLRR